MELFQHDGHLTDQALHALSDGDSLSELERLEIAEHLSYCDDCLLRYTGLMTEGNLETPPKDCRDGVWHRIRKRTFTLLSSRYATAAAALAIVVALWTFGVFGGMVQTSLHRPPATQSVPSWSQQWSASLSKGFSNMTHIFDFLGGPSSAPTEGGNS